MSKLAELESKHKRRLPPDDIHLRLRRDMDKAQKDTPVISKELFCTAIHLLKEQESIDDEFVERYRKSATVISHTGQRTNIGKLF